MSESLASALAAFQAALPSIHKGETAKVQTKTGGEYQYKFADLADVSGVVLPLLGAVGLSFSAKPTLRDNRFVLAYRLLHVSGEYDEGEYPLPSSGTPQEYGSAITYARRYALCSVVGVAPDKDDDGQAAKETRTFVDQKPVWDPIEQDVLVTGWLAEIQDAKDDAAIKAIGKNILTAKRTPGPEQLSPASYERLAKAGAARKAALNGATS